MKENRMEKITAALRTLMALVLTASMLASTVAAVPITALQAVQESVSQAAAEASASPQESGTAAQTLPVQEAPAADSEAVPTPDTAAEAAEPARTLTQTLTTAASETYTVTVTCPADAGVPEDAELSVKELVQKPQSIPKGEVRPYDTERFLSEEELADLTDGLTQGLGVEKADHVFFTRFFDISLISNEGKVELLAPVSVTIETDAMAPAAASAMEIAVLNDNNVWNALSVDDQSDGAGTRLTVSARTLSQIGLAGVVTPLRTWTVRDMALTILGPRSLTAEQVDARIGSAGTGQNTVTSFQLLETDAPNYGAALWLSAQPARRDGGTASGVVAFLLQGGMAGSPLFAAGGTSVPVELRSEDKVGLLWNADYYDTTLTDGSVTLEGVMPAGARAQAVDVRAEYAGQDALAAYDITITKNGREYQPGESLPVTVSISGRAIKAGMDLEVRHVLDDGTEEVISDVTVGDGSVTFQAAGFSVYYITGDHAVNRIIYQFFNLDEHGDYNLTFPVVDGNGNSVSKQSVRSGELPLIPQDPTDPREGAEGIFAGWYEPKYNNPGDPTSGYVNVTGPDKLQDTPYDFSSTYEENNKEIHLYAKYLTYSYLVFHGQFDEASNDYPVIKISREKMTSTEPVWISYDGVEADYYSSSDESGYPSQVFDRWSKSTDPTDQEAWVQPHGDVKEIQVSGTEHLYPVFKAVNYLSFYSGQSGSGASYYSARAVPVGGAVDSLPMPSRPGYAFKGWYTGFVSDDIDEKNGAAGEGIGKLVARPPTEQEVAQGKDPNELVLIEMEDNDAGVRVRYNGEHGELQLGKSMVKLYAGWKPAEVNYTILIWKQRAVDSDWLAGWTAGVNDNDDKTAYNEDASDTWKTGYNAGYPHRNDTPEQQAEALALLQSKTYDCAQRIIHQADTGTTISFAAGDEYTGRADSGSGYYDSSYDGYVCASWDDPKSVYYEGTTVLNVYYDYGTLPVATGSSYQLSFRYAADEDTPVKTADGTPVPDAAVRSGNNIAGFLPASDTLKPPAGFEVGYDFSGWYLDPACTVRAATMSDQDLTVYAGWEKHWYLIEIDPNYGEMNNDTQNSTWFWKVYNGDPIQEYTMVTRSYEESPSGMYYYVKRDRAYYGYTDKEYYSSESACTDRHADYTMDITKASELTTFKKSPGTYSYAGWYEVDPDTGTETKYVFGNNITSNVFLRLHWKKAGAFYLEYNPVVTVDGVQVKGQLNSGDDILDNVNCYFDDADILLTRSVTVPEGYVFAGWTVRGDDSGTVYRVGEEFSLPAEYAVTMSGKKTVFLDAVYTRVPMAQVIYDGNGGLYKDSTDYGQVIPESSWNYDPPAMTHVVSDDGKTLTVGNLVNNSKYQLAGQIFAAPDGSGADFAGWNTEPDGTGDPFAAGETYGVNAQEPLTLYAQWQVKVYYNNNSANTGDNGGGAWGDAAAAAWQAAGFTLVDGEYTKDVFLNAKLEAPLFDDMVIKEGFSFDYWGTASAGGGADAYDFAKETVSSSVRLYAHMTAGVKVPFHVTDGSLDKDDWRKGTDSLTVAGVNAISFGSLVEATWTWSDAAVSDYVAVPAGAYTFDYACISDSWDTFRAGELTMIRSIQENSGAVTVTLENGSDSSLDGKSVFLVYEPNVESATVKVCYVKETVGGALQEIAGANGQITVTYGDPGSEVTEQVQLNGVTVAQNQEVTVGKDEPLRVSQESMSFFNMPPNLDDGNAPLDLIYYKLAFGETGKSNVNDLRGCSDLELYLQVRDSKFCWSYDGETWTEFTEATPTIYAIYRERGYDLEISKIIPAYNVSISAAKTFPVRITSMSITRTSYDVEGTGYATIEAHPTIPAHGETPAVPGYIDLTVKDGSDVRIIGLEKGDAYTITEESNENYILTARKMAIGSNTFTPIEEGEAITVSLPYDDPDHPDLPDAKVVLYNTPRSICQIGTERFYSLNAAIDYMADNSMTSATVEMLVDYIMPSPDELEIPEGRTVTLTTASGDDYSGAGTCATITRDEGFTTAPMFTNRGTLILQNITLDGGAPAGAADPVLATRAMIKNTGTLRAESGTTLQNACNNLTSGGAILSESGAVTVSGAVFTNNRALVNGGAICVTGGSLTIQNDTGTGANAEFTDNRALNGGAVCYSGSNVVTIKGGIFGKAPVQDSEGHVIYYGNTAANGGAIYMASGTLLMPAPDSGGNYGELKLQYNTAANSDGDAKGGAIYIGSAVLSMERNGIKISNNTADIGGAIYSDSGLLSLSAGEISGNTAASGDGGAVCMDKGTINISGGSITDNTAASGNGGAVCSGTGTVNVTGGSITGNSAVNGSAIFVGQGVGNFSAGSITGNTASNGGAVGIALTETPGFDDKGQAVVKYTTSARLYFSGNAYITGNTMNGKPSNVYLNVDSDDVISAGGLGSSANIGIYVPDDHIYKGTHDPNPILFNRRGEPGVSFASYTDSTNLGKFHNDRLPTITTMANTDSRKVYWAMSLAVEVHYRASFTNGTYFNNLPQKTGGSWGDTPTYTNNTYYLPSCYNNISGIADDLRANYPIKVTSTTAMVAYAFLDNASSIPFADYVTDVNWDSSYVDQGTGNTGAWKFIKRDGTFAYGTKLVIYFSEPTYLNIENNDPGRNTLTISSLTLGNPAVPITNVTGDGGRPGYGYVFARNGSTQSSLELVTDADLVLAEGKAIKLMIPGGGSLGYSLTGAFAGGDSSNTIAVRQTGVSDTTVPATGSFTLDRGALQGANGTANVIFGGDRAICRVVVTPAQEQYIHTTYDVPRTDYTERYVRSDGTGGTPATETDGSGTDRSGVEYTFTTLNKAVSFIKKYLSIGGRTAGSIEMLADYQLPEDDVINLTGNAAKNWDLTLTTARDGINHYDTDGNRVFYNAPYAEYDFRNEKTWPCATISRNAGNNYSFVTIQSDASSTLNVSHLVLDGKNFSGLTINGGSVMTNRCKVTVKYAEFRNTTAADGGGMCVKYDDRPLVPGGDMESLTVEHSYFHVLESDTGNAQRKGGGAIWTNAKFLTVTDTTFANCTGVDQGGAIFHRIDTSQQNSSNDPYYDVNYSTGSTTVLTGCKFINCKARSGGAVESDAHHVTVTDCDFDNCSSAYSKKLNKYGSGGALCTYIYEKGPYISFGTKYPTDLTITSCTFRGCNTTGQNSNANTGNGGAVRSHSLVTTVEDCTFVGCTASNAGGALNISNGEATEATISGCTIKDCTASNAGGAVYTTALKLTIDDYEYDYTHAGNYGDNVFFNPNILHPNRTAPRDSSEGDYVRNDANQVTTRRTEIRNCTAAKEGGGVCQNRGTNNVAENKRCCTVTNCTIDNCTAKSNGGGLYTTVGPVTLTGCTIQNNRITVKNTTLNGGGVCDAFVGGILTIDGCTIQNNIAGGMGGGVYANQNDLTLRGNSMITGNSIANNTANNAGGVYLANNYTLYVGTQNSSTADISSIKGNKTEDGKDSNLRLWEKTGGQNHEESVVVYCDLSYQKVVEGITETVSGEICVVNAAFKGTQFGTAPDGSSTKKFTGFTDVTHVFISDDKDDPLYGVFDGSDPTNRTIIWRSPPICKITDGNDRLLYFDVDDPAIFDWLDDDVNDNNVHDGDRTSAFNTLRANDPQLKYKDSSGAYHPYYGDAYCVKMIVSKYDVTNPIRTKDIIGRSITFTTASTSDSDEYPGPYTGNAKDVCKIGMTSVVGNYALLTANHEMTLKNITLDGGSDRTVLPVTAYTNTRILDVRDTHGQWVTLGANATLQNAECTTDGGGVLVGANGMLKINGGTIRNCAAPNGGGVCVDGSGAKLQFADGSITRCTAAEKGGGIYWKQGSSGAGSSDGGSAPFLISGSITDNTAKTGGGVCMNTSDTIYTMRMTGGKITGNNASVNGGGIALVGDHGDNSQLEFSGLVTISDNTCDTSVARSKASNVELDYDSKTIIRTSGLSSSSYIGVYVTGEETGAEQNDPTATQFDKHGVELAPFGYYYEGSDSYLYCFVNDRNQLKGGLITNPAPNTIYWVKIFSMEVSKTVMSDSTADSEESFDFTVRLYYKDGNGIIKNVPVNGSKDRNPVPSRAFNNGVATVTLKSGETVLFEDLPAKYDGYPVQYSVTENMTDIQRNHFNVYPNSVQEGTMDENLNKTDVDSWYVVKADFINVHAVCKLTAKSSNSESNPVLLYYNNADNAKVPAIYNFVSNAVTALESRTQENKHLYYYDPYDDEWKDVAGDTSLKYSVEMLIPEHKMKVGVSTTTNTAFTLTTADKNATDGFQYVGNANTPAVILRDPSFKSSSMFTISNGADVTMKNITLDGNKAANVVCQSHGGIAWINQGKLTVTDNAALQNSKVNSSNRKAGGAIFLNSGSSTLEISGSAKLTGNEARNGGAVHAENGTVTMKGGTVSENTATNSGGAFFSHAVMTLSGGTIQNNTAQNTGGGIHFEGDKGTKTLTISGTKLRNNTATSGSSSGGAIYVKIGNLVMTGGQITGNKAATGGAFNLSANTTATVSGGTITDNKAATGGAGIYLTEGSQLTLSGKPDFWAGNFLESATLSGQTNGGEAYKNNKARQDIYIAGYANDNVSATSLAVSGNFDSSITNDENRKIWVWAAEDPRIHEGDQFGYITAENGNVSGETLAVFRNARTDTDTTGGVRTEPLVGTRGPGVTIIWGSAGMDVFFKKIDSYGAPQKNAAFSLYRSFEDAATNWEDTSKRVNVTIKVANDTVTQNFAPSTETYNSQTNCNVNFKVPTNVFFMRETAVPVGFKNDNVYLFLVGDAALQTACAANNPYGLTQADVQAQTGTGTDARRFAVFLLDDTGKVVKEEGSIAPDIAAYGIMNESVFGQEVILRKVVNGTYAPLEDAAFQILRSDRTKVKGSDIYGTKDVTAFSSGSSTDENRNSGVFYIGDLSYGTYYVHETTVPNGYSKLATDDNWFVLTVDEDGAGYRQNSLTILNKLLALTAEEVSAAGL